MVDAVRVSLTLRGGRLICHVIIQQERLELLPAWQACHAASRASARKRDRSAESGGPQCCSVQSDSRAIGKEPKKT